MKTVLKVIGKLVKWYLIFDAIVLAWIGAGKILSRCRRHPEETWLECDMAVIDSTVSSWKKWFRWVRGS